MARYTYRIDRYFSDTESWGIENDDARGTEDYDGDAQDYAREVLDNRIHDVESDRLIGRWRVLVWEGDEERDGGPDAADGWAETIRTEADYPNPGGRPKIGNIVSVAMGDTLPRVDAYAEENGIKRAEAIRKLVTIGLQAETEDVTTEQVRDLHRDWNQSAAIDRGPEREPITKADVLAAIDSYIEAGGEVNADGEPLEWDTVADQLNA